MVLASARVSKGARRLRFAVAVALLLVVPSLEVASLPSAPNAHFAAAVPASSAPVIVAPAFVPGSSVSVVGPLDAGTPLEVAVGLAPRDSSGLEAATALEYAPGSPAFHHFLSAGQIADRYGPMPSSVDRARAYFLAGHVNVTVSPDHLLLLLRGPAGELARDFHTQFDWYRSAGRLFYSHPVDATLPAGVPWSGALGLGNATPARSLVARAPSPALASSASCTSATIFIPCQVRNAYNLTSLFGSGVNGSGVRIGVVDPYDGNEPQTTLASDLRLFTAAYGLSVGRIQYLYPVPTSRNLNASYGLWGAEIALDLQWTRALAPGATLDMTFAPDASAGLYGAVDWLVAHQAVDVISLSWGESDVGIYNAFNGVCRSACNASSDGSYTLLHPVLADAAAEGIGVFVASGDCGAADGTSGVSTDYPASDPSVTGVGATDLSLSKTGGYGAESGWSGNDSGARSPGCQNQGGSGGGYSPFPRPVWQRAPGLSLSNSQRATPDVSILGGNDVATYLNGVVSPAAGTSASAPMWAGIAAVADQSAGTALGSLSPSLYAVARSSNYSRAFHDIRTGNNGYPAGAGWDAVTGLGSPNASRLIPLLVGGASPPGNLSTTVHANPRFGLAPLTPDFYLNASGGSGRYPLYDVSFGDGNATLTTGRWANHTYPYAGVYSVQSVVFDSAGNTSVAPPVAVVVGGGGALTVSLGANNTTPFLGQPVQFTANVSGGRAAYSILWSFGDGSYANWSNASTQTHVYAEPGGLCAAVVVRDSATPVDGAASPRLPLTVGGGVSPKCDAPATLWATLSSSLTFADLPGDFPLRTTTAGGTPPARVTYTSDDPYVAACQCGIFLTAGVHEVFAFANDSLGQQTVATFNVTLFPALSGRFQASVANGSAPLRVNFSAQSSGGRLPNDNLTRWNFGDGVSTVSQNATHVYPLPGEYVAVGSLSDRGHGNVSEGFLIDVRAPANATLPGLAGNVTPAVLGGAGGPIRFNASVTGRGAPFELHWDLGRGGSAWGGSVAQSYSLAGCLGNGTCPLRVTVNVTNQSGRALTMVLDLQPLLAGRTNNLSLIDNVSALSGATPFNFTGSGTVGGVRGARLAWSYGDGATSPGLQAVHQYLTPGNYTLVETATDGFGGTFVHTHAVSVTGIPRAPPTLSGGPSWTSGIVPLTVFFNVTATGGSGPPYNATWKFGDGGGGSGGSVTHVYTRVGAFAARVSVVDSAGISAVANWTVDTYNLTQVDVLVGATPPVVGPGASVRLGIRAAAHCGPSSIPQCGAAHVKVDLWFSDQPGVIPIPHGPPPLPVYALSATGQVNLTVDAGSLPGRYTVTVCACSEGYEGSANASFQVTVSSTTAFSLSTLAVPLLVVGAVAAVALTLALGYRHRGRRRARKKSTLDDA